MIPDVRAWLDEAFPFGVVERDGAVVGCWVCSDVVRLRGPDGRSIPEGRSSGVRGVMRARDGRLVGANVHVRAPDDHGACVLRALSAAEAGAPTPVGSPRLRGRSRDASPTGQGGLVLQLVLAIAGGTSPGGERDRANAERMLSTLTQLLGRDVEDDASMELAIEHSRRRTDTVGRFLSTVDGATLRLVDAHGRHMAEAFGEAWDGLDPSMTPGAPLARALEAHPLMPMTLADGWLRAPAPFARDVLAGETSRAVERGCRSARSVPDRLLGSVGMAEAAFARMEPARRASWVSMLSDDRRDDTVDAPVTLVRLLASLPADWVPRDGAGWDALLAVGPVLSVVSWLVRDGEGWSRLVNAGGRWAEFHARLSAAARGLELWDAVGDVLHVARAYADQVLVPAMAIATGAHPHAAMVGSTGGMDEEARPSSCAYALLFSGRSMPRMLETSTAWHGRAPAIAAAVAAMCAPSGPGSGPPFRPTWPAAFPDRSEGALALVVLTDDASLVAEGARPGEGADGEGLSHCVGGYGGACRAGRCRIASVRRLGEGDAFERLSTVELTLVDGRAVVVDHRGRSNAAPPAEAVALVLRYVASLGNGTSEVDAEGLAPVRGGDSISSVAGYEWHLPGRWEAVRDLWATHVPRRIRSLDAPSLARLADAVPFADGQGGAPTWCAEPFGEDVPAAAARP